MILTPQQLKSYNKKGFAGPNPILSKIELKKLHYEIDSIISNLPSETRPENLPSPNEYNEFILNLLLSDPFVDVAEQILGPDISLFTVYAICKPPYDGRPVKWHQDAAYFPIEPMETFTLWLAVDDSNSINGCMKVLPSSHKTKKIYEHSVNFNDESVLVQSITDIDLNGAMDVEVPAGHYSIHDPFLLHGSNKNNSSKWRCGITIKYIPTYVNLDRDYIGPSGFNWKDHKLFHARGKRGTHKYEN